MDHRGGTGIRGRSVDHGLPGFRVGNTADRARTLGCKALPEHLVESGYLVDVRWFFHGRGLVQDRPRPAAFCVSPSSLLVAVPDRVLLAIMLTSAVASMFISNTSTTVLMVGAVLPLVRQMGGQEPFSKGIADCDSRGGLGGWHGDHYR